MCASWQMHTTALLSHRKERCWFSSCCKGHAREQVWVSQSRTSGRQSGGNKSPAPPSLYPTSRLYMEIDDTSLKCLQIMRCLMWRRAEQSVAYLLSWSTVRKPCQHKHQCSWNDSNRWKWEVNSSWMTVLVPYWSAGAALMWESGASDLHPLPRPTWGRSSFIGGNCVLWTWISDLVSEEDHMNATTDVRQHCADCLQGSWFLSHKLWIFGNDLNVLIIC